MTFVFMKVPINPNILHFSVLAKMKSHEVKGQKD